ncbi:DUF6893 family small protein [Streptacidiphilus melanogenes]
MIKFLCGMTVLAAVGIAVANMDDIKRYLKMRSM